MWDCVFIMNVVFKEEQLKRLNILCSIVLAVTLTIFGAYNYNIYKNLDKKGPVFKMDSDIIEVSVKDDNSVLLQGMHAEDEKDGDVTDSIGIESITEFINEDSATRQVNYVAFDNDSHVTKASRRLVYTDYTPIHFSLTAPLRFPEQSSNINIMGIIHAEDCIDGDISSQIAFSEDSVIQVDIASDYDVTLCVTNSAGDTEEIPVTVRIYDQSTERALPQIKLTDYLIYINKGKIIDPYQYIESVTFNGVEYLTTKGEGTFAIDTSEMTREEKEKYISSDPEVSIDRFKVNDMVDYGSPGVYEIKYTIDTLDGERGTVYMIVVVE